MPPLFPRGRLWEICHRIDKYLGIKGIGRETALLRGCARARSRARVTLPRSGICRMWRTRYMSSPAVESFGPSRPE